MASICQGAGRIPSRAWCGIFFAVIAVNFECAIFDGDRVETQRITTR